MPVFSPATVAAVQRIRERAARSVERSPRSTLMTMAVPVGLVAGLGAIGFTELIRFIDWFAFDIVMDEWLGALPGWRLILIPALGAILVGPITRVFAPEARGHGVPEVMLAVETQGGRIRPRVAIAKSIASALSIGSGGSVGKEGPIAQIGSAFGSTMGQVLRLSDEHIKLLVAAGAGAGIAGTFNAPIAGVFFALEVILRRFNTRNFSVVVLASVVGTATAAAVLGGGRAIPIPEYRLDHAPVEIPLYVLLGVFIAFFAVAFTHAVYWAEDRFDELPFPPQLFMPVLGGLIVGVLGLVDRGVLGLGQETMVQAVTGNRTAEALATLLVLKLAATSITIGSGGSGGIFRPSLFMGAMAGGAFGFLAHTIAPGFTATSGAYATVGMGAMFAGAARAPITAVVIMFEMTSDYALILPLMTSVAVATAVAQWLSRGSIYTIKLQRRGIEIEEEVTPAPVTVMGSLSVDAAMSPVRVTVSPDAPASEVMMALRGEPESAALVVDDEGGLVGIITQVDLNEAIADETEAPARDLCTTDPRTIFPDETLHHALGIFASRNVHALPVVPRDDPRTVIGMLWRSDITRAYTSAIEQRVALSHRQRLDGVTGDDVRYLDLTVTPESGLDGLVLSELDLTEDAIVVAVRHDGVTAIPRGHTRLAAGDRVTVIAAGAVVAEVRAIFEGAAPRR